MYRMKAGWSVWNTPPLATQCATSTQVHGNNSFFSHIPNHSPSPLPITFSRLRLRLESQDGVCGDEGHVSLSKAGGDALRWTVRETMVEVVAVERREVWREIRLRVWMEEKDTPNIRVWG